MVPFDKVKLPPGEKYELMFSDDDTSAILMGIASTGEDIIKTDAEIFTKSVRNVNGRDYLFDSNTGSNKKIQSLTSRFRLARPPPQKKTHTNEAVYSVSLFGFKYLWVFWEGRLWHWF